MKKRRRIPLLCKFLIIFLILLLISAGALWYAWKIEPYDVQTVRTQFELPQWRSNPNRRPLRIVVAGDLHLRPDGGDLARLYMEHIMAQSPDMIILMGDYANGHTRESSMTPETAKEYFAMLKAPLGIFAVQGNHDQWYGWAEWCNMFLSLGIHGMLNDMVLVNLPDGRLLQLSTVRDDYNKRVSKDELPKRYSPDVPNILLTHVPDVFPLMAPGQFDMAISAHTHGGQICLPNGTAPSNISREKDSFTYPWDTLNGTPFLITKGLGCSVLPLRFCCKPEIILLEL